MALGSLLPHGWGLLVPACSQRGAGFPYSPNVCPGALFNPLLQFFLAELPEFGEVDLSKAVHFFVCYNSVVTLIILIGGLWIMRYLPMQRENDFNGRCQGDFQGDFSGSCTPCNNGALAVCFSGE